MEISPPLTVFTLRKAVTKLNLDGFSMRPLVSELAKVLTGGRVDKITQQNKANFTITVRNFGQSAQNFRRAAKSFNPSDSKFAGKFAGAANFLHGAAQKSRRRQNRRNPPV